MNGSWLLLSFLFGTFGLAFFVYGKKQAAVVPLACGLVLMVVPYFISNTMLLAIVGALLMIVPYFLRF